MKSFTKLGLTAAIVVSLALTGCSGGGETADPGDAEPVAGGTLTWAIPTQPAAGGLDPMVATTIPATLIMNQAYDTLLSRDADGAIVPALAESWEQPDNTTYVFTLRDDVQFADGTPFTADDVVYTYETYQTAQTSKKTYLADMAGVVATGEHEVTFTLAQPNSTFLSAASGPQSLMVVGREGYGGATEDERQTQTFGTGPFQVVSWTDGVSIKLEKNENYWKEDGRPYIDEIDFAVIPDDVTRLAALQQGTAQAAYFNDGTVAKQAEQAGFTLGDPVYTGILSLYINPTEGPLADVNVRRAVSLALDRQDLVDTGVLGNAAVTTSVAVGDPGAPQPGEDTPNYTRDVEEAKRLLAEAGQPNPEISISYLSDSSPAHHPVYELMQRQLAEAGIALTLDPTPLAELAPVWTSGKGWKDIVAIPGSNKADPVFHYTSLFGDGAPLNLWADNPDAATAIDLFHGMTRETDLDARDDLVQQIVDEVADEVLLLTPFADPVVFEIWNPDTLHGYDNDPYNARLRLAESWVTP